MKNEDRLIEVMLDLLAEVHEMRTDTSKQLSTLNGKVEKLEQEMIKVNLQLAENTRAILKLADMNDRVIRLENYVFRKTG